MANDYKPVLTANNSAEADAVKGTVGATTTEWTINVSDIGASGTAVTVTSAPASYTLDGTGFAASQTSGVITISNIDVTLATGDTLAANDATVTWTIELLGTGSAQWNPVATGTFKNAVVNTSGDIFGSGATLTGTYGAGTYRVCGTGQRSAGQVNSVGIVAVGPISDFGRIHLTDTGFQLDSNDNGFPNPKVNSAAYDYDYIAFR